MLTGYVCGFALHGDHVALIRKNRPDWQAGKLNGIGGHIEPGESPYDAMVREFFEETGVQTHMSVWDRFLIMSFPGAYIHFYRARLSQTQFEQIKSTTDEVVVKVDSRSLGQIGCIPNLLWLVPLAAYTADVYEPITVNASQATS